MEIEFKVLTLNCWGIPFISKDVLPRMRSIAEYLGKSDYDVVCLQEVWAIADYNLIRDVVVSTYPFSHYFYSGVIGSGVCIFSKYLLQDVFFHQWPLNGYIHKIQHGDWFAGKGIAMCRVIVKGFSVNIYTSHLLAEYNRTCDEYETHRMLQVFDTAQFIQLTSGAADFIVLAGDLNTEPGDLPHRFV
uniref:sphingomyelin phosphodiesterase n=1 Tax=Photinus pyralis TaxID=7054 RepID=A0A1Y1JYV0_PHOPY